MEDDLDFTLENFSLELIQKVRNVYKGREYKLQKGVYAKFLNDSECSPDWKHHLIIYSYSCPINACPDIRCNWPLACKGHSPSFIIIHNMKTGTIAETLGMFGWVKEEYWKKHPPVEVETVDGELVNVPFDPSDSNSIFSSLWDGAPFLNNLLEGYVLPNVIHGVLVPFEHGRQLNCSKYTLFGQDFSTIFKFLFEFCQRKWIK